MTFRARPIARGRTKATESQSDHRDKHLQDLTNVPQLQSQSPIRILKSHDQQVQATEYLGSAAMTPRINPSQIIQEDLSHTTARDRMHPLDIIFKDPYDVVSLSGVHLEWRDRYSSWSE
jgi:hypothetical protein